MQTHILHGDTERIQTPPLKDGSLNILTGLTTVVVSLQRTSDGHFLDFSDDTFKATGWTTRQQQMNEVSAALASGEYYYDLVTGDLVNPAVDDTYMVRVEETGGTAVNVPLVGEIKVDQWAAKSTGLRSV